MADITAIEAFPPVTTGPWNPNNPVQAWSDPAMAAAIAADPTTADNLAVYTTWRVNAATGAVSTYQFGIPYSQAAVANIPPAGYTSVPGNATINSPNFPPIDLAQLKAGGKYAGYTIQPNPLAIFNAPPLLVAPVPTPAAIPTGTDPVEAEILQDVRDIDKREGGTPV